MEGKSLGQAFGSLIFTCNGRGRNLFGEQNYDSSKVSEFIPVPSSGFLCNGMLSSVLQTVTLCVSAHTPHNSRFVLSRPAVQAW